MRSDTMPASNDQDDMLRVMWMRRTNDKSIVADGAILLFIDRCAQKIVQMLNALDYDAIILA